MFTPEKIRRGMVFTFYSLLGIGIYKLVFHGLHDALLFLPLLGLWLVATLVVHFVTRRHCFHT